LAARLDHLVFHWLRSFQPAFLTMVMAGLSDVARGAILWFALALLVPCVRPGRWQAAFQAVLAIALTIVVVETVAKPLFNRARPYDTYPDTVTLVHRPSTSSLPSGHAANAIAAAYVLSRLAPEARGIFWLLALLVAISRVYLGVHYPADVLAGAAIGWGVAAFVVGRTVWRFSSSSTGAHA
jgi:undecaprenyl-diphosphatase